MATQVNDILLRKNLRNVVSILNREGDLAEEIVYIPTTINTDEIIHGVAELNRNGIVVFDIVAGKNREGTTKITNIRDFGIYRDGAWIYRPTEESYETSLPEGEFIPFKSDAWILGEYLARIKTSKKTIPKRFLKSQNMLDRYLDNDPILTKLLVIDPEKRSVALDFFEKEDEKQGCIII